MIEMRTSAKDSQQRSASGVVVFDPALPRYPDDPQDGGDSLVVGRVYIDLRMLGQTMSPAGTQSEPVFDQFEGSDRTETGYGRLRTGDDVVIELAPHVNDAAPTLVGTLRNDTVVGRWHVRSDTDTASGAFRMWRVPTDASSDSARTRSRRGVAAWSRS
jgi:hypothetical protein